MPFTTSVGLTTHHFSTTLSRTHVDPLPGSRPHGQSYIDKRPPTLPAHFGQIICQSVATIAYFVVTQPTPGAQWINGQTNALRWEKGLLDGIVGYDIELTRMSEDALILVAKNGTVVFASSLAVDTDNLPCPVPAKPGGLNVHLSNVPPGDDYVAIFINSTHGVLQGTSQRFSILAANGTPTTPSTGDGKGPQDEVKGAATVSVTSGPNPTQAVFATTFEALPWSGAVRRWGAGAAWAGVGVSLGVVLVSGALVVV